MNDRCWQRLNNAYLIIEQLCEALEFKNRETTPNDFDDGATEVKWSAAECEKLIATAKVLISQ